MPKDKLAAALDGNFKPLNYTDASPSWAWTAGGGISTAGELATYVKALVGGSLLDAKDAEDSLRFHPANHVRRGLWPRDRAVRTDVWP